MSLDSAPARKSAFNAITQTGLLLPVVGGGINVADARHLWRSYNGLFDPARDVSYVDEVTRPTRGPIDSVAF